MAYIGKQPIVGNFVKLDAITTSATATYNLLNGGVAYYPQSANNCIVSLNGVIQSPTSAYTISGSTIVFSDALTSSDTIDFILVLGDVLSIGTPSDGTITSAKLASGVSGLISWQSVQTSGFTAVAGRGYPCNTTSSAFTVTLPASPSVGDTIILLDYAGTFATNNLTITSTLKINGSDNDVKLTTNREGSTLTYVDVTQGWVASSGVNEGTAPSLTDSPPSYTVDFLVIAGGGSGGSGTAAPWARTGGGGGAGGYRNSYSTETSGGGGSSEASLTFTPGTVYTVTVGAGGASTTAASQNGTTGSNSSISGTGITTITSSGGGAGGRGLNPAAAAGGSGGSGGGGGSAETTGGAGGSGTANQGYAGGAGPGSSTLGGGGGGGASATGTNGGGTSPSSYMGGAGGNGLASSITGSSVTRAGGGGGASYNSETAPAGGTGGGGAGGNFNGNAVSGTVNTGSGGGGSGDNEGSPYYISGAGGKGVVILRIPTANYSGTTTGSPTVTTDGSDKVIVFNDSGSITG
jgi:hypothetical protein